MLISLRLLALVAVVAIAGCSGCRDESTMGAGPSAVVKAPVPAPAALAAEVQVARPATLIASVRAAAGGSALFLPRTVGGSTASLLGLPIQIAELVDEQLPIVGAIALPKDTIQVAFAVHVSDPARLTTFVAGGRDATFTADREGEVTWLRPRQADRRVSVEAAVGLVDNYLVAGNDEAAVRALGPYLTRTLAAKPVPQSDMHVAVTGAAAGPLRARLEGLSALKLPVPAPIAAWLPAGDLSETLRTLLEGVGAGTIDLRLGERLEIEARFEREGADRPDVSPKALLELPHDVVAAIAWADRVDDRVAQSEARAAALRKAIAGSERDEAAIREALAQVARGMGERLTLGLRCTGVGLTGLAQGEVADEKALASGLEALAALRDHDGVEARLKEAGLSLSFKKRRLERVPFDLFRLRLEGGNAEPTPETGAQAAAPMSEIDFLYGLDGARFVAAAGKETVETTQRLVDPGETLASREPLSAALARLPDPVWLAAVVDAQGLHACTLGTPGGIPMPIVVGVGAAEGGLRLRFEMSRLLLRTLADSL